MPSLPIALTPMKIQEFFTPIIKLAQQLKNNAKKMSVKTAQEPLITVSHHVIIVRMHRKNYLIS